ncbi:hypothetical protein NicSoilB4_15010 [Arthrobacter sp. NicSoilB4]|nr:hypothetical protein NicSoilB4_15010 [Arthrobacter sp. NicSoilB4]
MPGQSARSRPNRPPAVRVPYLDAQYTFAFQPRPNLAVRVRILGGLAGQEFGVDPKSWRECHKYQSEDAHQLDLHDGGPGLGMLRSPMVIGLQPAVAAISVCGHQRFAA